MFRLAACRMMRSLQGQHTDEVLPQNSTDSTTNRNGPGLQTSSCLQARASHSSNAGERAFSGPSCALTPCNAPGSTDYSRRAGLQRRLSLWRRKNSERKTTAFPDTAGKLRPGYEGILGMEAHRHVAKLTWLKRLQTSSVHQIWGHANHADLE